MAYDLAPVELAAMTRPSDAAAAAKAALATRVPAGSSDMLAALEDAMARLPEGGVITLIGDGMSVADLIKPSELTPVTELAQERGVAVQAFGVGSNIDQQMLGVLANQTGGIVLVDDVEADAAAADIAAELADASHVLPVLPERVALESVEGGVIGEPLPLRADRMTYLLAVGEPTGEVAVAVDGRRIEPVVRDRGNTFLQGLAFEADATDGIVNPLAGDRLLGAARESFERYVAVLEQQAQIALAARDWERAEALAFEIRRIDPKNVRAVVVLEAVGNKTMTLVQSDAAPGTPAFDLPPGQALDNAADADAEAGDGGMIANPSVDEGGDDFLGELDVAPRDLDPLSAYSERQRLAGERLQSEIELGIERSRNLLEDDPESALNDLQVLRGAVKSAADVRPELRESLLRRLEANILSVENRLEAIVARQELAQNRRAAREAQERLVSALAVKEQKLAQLAEQVAALMAQGAAGNEAAWEEAEAVARIIDAMEPGSALGAATIFNTEAAGQLDKAYRLRAIRADKFLAQLYEVERSAIPFPDEPPVNYPSPERWQEITEMREKYKSVDLHKNSPNEEEILRALDKNTVLEFQDTPLSEAIAYIAELHGITIRIDENSIQEVGITRDEPISLFLSDVSLRSAFKIMLEDLELTYVIRDEIMQIVSVAEAEENRQVRVYPVADLVIPIQIIGGGGGGGGIGGGGGAGGLGGGGGAGGGFGGGGGGGFFSVPADDAPVLPDAKKK